MADIVLRAEALSKRFGRIVAVDGIDFAVARGRTVGLLGGNGAGKTTTIAMILGLVTPSAGRIEVFGHDAARERELTLPRMNFSSTYVELPYRLTVRENLTVFAHLYEVPDVRRRIAELAEDMQLGEFLDRRYASLSAGQKTRVALAKALVNRPELLLLDEPTASLDPETADWVRAYLQEYRRDSRATILMASHNMAEVERLCDDVLLMQRGRIVERGTPAELVARHGRADLEETYLHLARGGEPHPEAAE